MKNILIIVLSLSYLLSYADMGPKPMKKVTLEFYNDKTPITDIDSILVIVNAYYGGIDTFIIHGIDSWKARRYDLHPLKATNKGFQFETAWIVESFNATLIIDNKLYKTGLINHNSGNTLYKFDINDNMRDVSPLLYTEWERYFLTFLITIIIELLISLPFTIKHKLVTKFYFFASFIFINLITHFSLWFIESRAKVSIVILEIIVIIIEYFYWKYFCRFSKSESILISILTNLGSWIIGAIIGYFIWMQ